MRFKKICRFCGEDFYGKRNSTMCSDDCRAKDGAKNGREYYHNHKEKFIIKGLKLRFEIFIRDNFTCQLCGRKVPEVILEIDHRFPKSKGGLDKIENYITSCRDCNVGKGDVILKNTK